MLGVARPPPPTLAPATVARVVEWVGLEASNSTSGRCRGLPTQARRTTSTSSTNTSTAAWLGVEVGDGGGEGQTRGHLTGEAKVANLEAACLG